MFTVLATENQPALCLDERRQLIDTSVILKKRPFIAVHSSKTPLDESSYPDCGWWHEVGCMTSRCEGRSKQAAQSLLLSLPHSYFFRKHMILVSAKPTIAASVAAVKEQQETELSELMWGSSALPAGVSGAHARQICESTDKYNRSESSRLGVILFNKPRVKHSLHVCFFF